MVVSMTDAPDSLFERIAGQAEGGLPPVHRWQPEVEKDIGMRISRDGTWWYQGSPIRRERMVRMFSRVLRRDGDEYFLVTPVEKVRVEVEAAPLLAIRMERRHAGGTPELAFETNVGDLVVADARHPIIMHGTPETPTPVVVVRDTIEALLVRGVYYELVEHGEVENGALVVRSRGQVFELGAV